MIRAALFDLDGVILDTEPHYSRFWGELCQLYFPDKQGLAESIKGQSLAQIYSSVFAGMEAEYPVITKRLNDFEQAMTYDYISDFADFISEIRKSDLLTAIVTSSNQEKMEKVFRAHPELPNWFDAIITAESVSRSKPAPDIYLKGAEILGCEPVECIGFEDSINGLKAVRSAGMAVVGLATTNPRSVIEPLADMVVDGYRNFSVEMLLKKYFPTR